MLAKTGFAVASPDHGGRHQFARELARQLAGIATQDAARIDRREPTILE